MLKVLVVDDAVTERVRIGGIASKWHDCTVLEAENGRVALTQIEAHRPDLVLTDLQMPEMNGLELVAAVKEDFPHVPVILMTAQGSEEIAAQALRSGAASYVPKLRLADDLLSTLSQVYQTVQDEQCPSYLMHYVTGTVTSFSLPNDVTLMRACVNHLLSMLRCLPLGDVTERMRVGIALQEAINNAYYHGNLEVSEVAGSDHSRFDSVAAARIYEAPYVSRRTHETADITRERAIFVIRHDGPGINRTVLADDENRGRGMTLMESIMDDVTYSDAGDSVRLLRNAVHNEDALDDDDDDE